jgi:hypothetical protein
VVVTALASRLRQVSAAVVLRLPLISLVLWVVAIWVGLLGLVLSFGEGRTTTTEVLFGITFCSGALGALADHVRRTR